MSDKYPYYCVEPDCGISDCNECPFSPVVQYEKIKALKFNVDNLVKFQEGYINRIINLESVLISQDLVEWLKTSLERAHEYLVLGKLMKEVDNQK